MQGLGFVYCLEPWIDRCYADRAKERTEALIRHQEFFNTQPYMASLLIGMVCALEEDASTSGPEERPVKLERLRVLKAGAAAALAGMGDAFFWGTLRPFGAALSLILWMVLRTRMGWLGAALGAAGAYLVAYNLPAQWWRWHSLRKGYEWRDAIAEHLKDIPVQAAMRVLRLTGLVGVVVIVTLMMSAAPWEQRLAGGVALAVYAGLKFLPVSAYRLYAASCAAGILAALAGWM
jgi:mannose/fructose/N-acetylgalactosamine-specific phosphotransferase system component IID